MKLTTFLVKAALALLAVFLLLRQVAANPIQETPALSDAGLPHIYPITPMRFEGTIHGISLNTTGTIEEIYAEVAKDPLFSFFQNTKDRALAAREKAIPTKILCIPVPGQDWYMANQAAIEDGIRYLRGMVGYCTLSPQNCHRVSCSYGAGIYVCNDNTYDVRPLCSTLGAYAQEIINAGCRKLQWLHYVVGGQAFGMEGFNVIVHTDKC